jgi:hypothetical protein
MTKDRLFVDLVKRKEIFPYKTIMTLGGYYFLKLYVSNL